MMAPTPARPRTRDGRAPVPDEWAPSFRFSVQQGTAMRAFTLPAVTPPLFSLVIFILGHGLLTTLLSIRLSAEQVSAQWIGLLSTGYFAGLVIGSFINARLIIRVGHIRAYAAYASLLACICILHGLVVEPATWVLLRLLGGFATGGLFVVIESWMLVSSTPATRGRLMALYMILLYGALAGGQLLLKYVDPLQLAPFALIAMTASLSVVPLALTRVAMPVQESPQPISFLALLRLTPSGMWGCFASGLILGALYGLLPLFFTDSGYTLNRVANMMAVVIFGGMCLQYPLGRISDRFDRRLIICGLAIGLTLISLLMLMLPAPQPRWALASLTFLFGGLAFSIYPMSLSHSCDELTPAQVISANQGLLLSYSLGAMIGPVLAPSAITLLGPKGLFAYFTLCSAGLAVYLMWRKRVRAPVPMAEHQAYMPIPPNTPVGAELDPRTQQEPH